MIFTFEFRFFTQYCMAEDPIIVVAGNIKGNPLKI